ncbi:MAG: HAD family hydrolase [Planctomycetota bacterium]|nr:HAD family hydrolase [Planctomycetota bacterium]MDA1179403.1 HAD family hydrolase [Planctomycetota bacterium]
MLLLFDIDGTLTNTYGVDSDCYVSALWSTFGIDNVDTDWTTYPDATDSAILEHIFQTRFNRGPTIDETTRMIDCFQSSLVNAFESDPTRCEPIVGGPRFIANLVRDNIAFAVATGGWKPTANLKLSAAGYQMSETPIATANDATRRTDICKLAVDRACEHYGRSFNHVTYIGDGLWDAQAAQQLGYHFVGRSEDEFKFLGLTSRFVIPHFDLSDLKERLLALKMGV